MRGRGVCVAGGSIHGRGMRGGGHAWWGGHAWQGACVAEGCAWQGHAWQVGGSMVMHGRGHVWHWSEHGNRGMHDRRACMVEGMHGRWCVWQWGHAWHWGVPCVS